MTFELQKAVGYENRSSGIRLRTVWYQISLISLNYTQQIPSKQWHNTPMYTASRTRRSSSEFFFVYLFLFLALSFRPSPYLFIHSSLIFFSTSTCVTSKVPLFVMFGWIRKLVMVAAFPECAEKGFPYSFFFFFRLFLYMLFTQMTLPFLKK